MKANWRTLVSRIRSLFRRRRLEEDMAEEMHQHIEELARSYVADGLSSEEAQFAARRRFGGVAQIEERCRDEHGFAWWDQFRNDIRFTVRSLCRSRGYTITVLLTLFLGIGVTTAVFELTSRLLFYRLPYPRAEELVCFGYKDKQSEAYYSFGLQFQAYQEQANAFSEFAATQGVESNLVVNGEPLALWVQHISVDCLRTLGVRPALGRGFIPEEHRPGANNVVVISDLFWRQHFNAAPDILGRTILINREACTVVGVLAGSQQLPNLFGGDVYRPLVLKIDPANLGQELELIGRLKPGVSREQALAAVSKITFPGIQQWEKDYFANFKPILTPISEMASKGNDWVIFLAAMFLYAIACLNAMNLMLIRLLGRRRELSIRLSIGGSRWQVVQLLAIEALVLTSVASLSVLFAVRWLFPPLFVLISGNEGWGLNNPWDTGTLCCIAALSALASVAVVLVPAFRLFRTEINSGLKDGGPSLGESGRTGRFRDALVVLQAAFAVILLVGAGLMVRSFDRLNHLNLGFERAGKVKVQIAFPENYQLKPLERLQLFQRLRDRVSTLPGVRSASYSQDSIFLGYFAGTAELRLEDGSFVPAAGNFVSSDFQKTAGLVMKEGRWLSGKPNQFEAVINETFAKARFGDREPVGLSFKIKVSGDLAYPVVGVVKDVLDTVRSSPGIRFYAPDWVYPPNIDTLVLRMDSDPKKEFEGLVRRAIFGVDSRIIVSRVRTIDDLFSDSMWEERLAFTILKSLSVIALGLAIVGVFSVIAYAVDRRMPEFGIRIALGATSADLRRLVMMRGLSATAAGLAIGIAGAAGLTRFMESLLFETEPYDPAVYLGVALVLLLAGSAACWLPAQRAAKADVARLLKAD
jgi:predicted permease